MVEHLAKVAAIHPSTARRTSIKMLVFGQIAHARANVLPALVPLGLSLLLLLLLLLLLYRSPLVLRRHPSCRELVNAAKKGFVP